MKKSTMSYVIACWKKGVPHGIQVTNDHFTLVPLDSQTNVSKLLNNPHRTQMQKFLNWIATVQAGPNKHGAVRHSSPSRACSILLQLC